MINEMTSLAGGEDGFLSDIAGSLTKAVGGIISDVPTWVNSAVEKQINKPSQNTFQGDGNATTTNTGGNPFNQKQMLMIAGIVGVVLLFAVMKK